MAAEATAALAQLLEPHGVLAWLATYLGHSTLLLGAAWVASRRLRGRSLVVEERLWKAALVGGLLTATVQTGLAALPAPPEPAAEAVSARVVVAASSLPDRWTPGTPAVSATAPAVTPHPRLGGLAAALPGWQRLALAVWIGGCLLLAGGVALGWLRLRLRLRGREDVAAGPAGQLLDRILDRTATRRPVRLTGSAALPVPVALGVGEREICLPRRALRELDERRQEGLLAHELAHLERRDPAWLLGALAVQSVFFFQPLNRVARRRLEEIAELRCDEWAVRITGDRVGLARCLTEVASWLVAEPSALPAPGMARSPSGLGDRVRRILDGGAEGGDGPDRRRWLPSAAAAALVAAVLLVPGLSPATFAEPDPAAAPADRAVATEPATPPAEGEPAGDPATDPEPAEASSRDRRDGRDGGRRGLERKHAHGHRHESEHVHEHDFDHVHDFDFDFDWHGWVMPDAEEISRAIAQAMAAAHAAMPDPEDWQAMQEEMREAVEEAMEARDEAMEMQREALEEVARSLEIELEGLDAQRQLTAAEKARLREEIAREMAAAHEEMERALAALRPELEAIERMNLSIEKDLAEELERREEPPPLR